MEKSFAFFDFDGTLIQGDSIVAFSLYSLRRGWCSTGCFLSGVAAAVKYKLGKCTAEEAKEKALAFLKDKTVAQADEYARAFCKDVLSKRLYSMGLEKIRQLREAGVTVWLVSASPSFYLEEMLPWLPVDRVIATRLAVDSDGVLTGRIFGENCKGVQKTLRLAEVLASLGEEVDYEHSSAYGDSASDIPMLTLCEKSVCVNAKAKLRKEMAGKAEFVHWH